MSDRNDFDAIVVGASLAGCTVATLLARAGATVGLVERKPDPQAFKRICSHYIQSSAVPTLERLGLLDEILAAGGVRSGIRIWTRWGMIEPPDAADVPLGVNIRRERLDPMLRALAARRPGVELIIGQPVTALAREGDRVVGVELTDRRSGVRRLRASLVVGADGRDSDVARLAGAPTRVLPHGRFAYGAYFEGPPPAGAPDSTIWFLDPQWAAAFPTDSGLTFYACMLTKERLAEFRRDLDRSLKSFIADLPDAPPILASRQVSSLLGKIEMPNVMRAPVSPGLALAGDAALATDPLFGVGCGFALQTGEWLADSVAPALRGEEPLKAGLARYRRYYRRRLAGHAFLIHDYAPGRRLNVVERILFSAAARNPAVSVGFGLFGTRNAGPGTLAITVGRAVTANARWRLLPRGESDASGPGGGGVTAPGAGVVSEMRVRVRDTDVRVLQAGSAADEAVVFVHGNPGSADDWLPLLEAVGTVVPAVAADLPDFGQTKAPANFGHSVFAYAAFVEELLAALQIGRVHLVVHDFGGPIGLAWAADNPERLASVTLINTGILPGYRWHRLARIWRAPLLGELFQAITTRAGFRTLIRRNEPRGLPRGFLDRMYDQYDTRTRRAVLRLYRATDDPGSAAPLLTAALVDRDVRALVIWGEHDSYLPSSFAVRQRDAFPSADIHILPASGHWPHVDAHETVRRLLLEFIGISATTSASGSSAPATDPRLAPTTTTQ